MRIPENFLLMPFKMEINNLKIFLTFWSKEKQIFLLPLIDYDISPLVIVKFLNLKLLIKFLSREISIHW